MIFAIATLYCSDSAILQTVGGNAKGVTVESTTDGQTMWSDGVDPTVQRHLLLQAPSLLECAGEWSRALRMDVYSVTVSVNAR